MEEPKMLRRFALIIFVAVLAAGCSGGSGGALDDLIEQVRLDDPLSSRTYQEHQAEIEVPASVPKLTEHLTSDPSPKVRQYCALILGRIADPQATAALTTALSDDDAGVRGRAVDALRQIGETEAQAAFVEALGSGSNAAKITVLVELEKEAVVDAIPAIADLARANEGMVSKNAIDTLGGIGDVSAVAPLVEMALNPGMGENLRRAAIMNLGRIDDPAADAGLEEVVAGLGEQEGVEALLEFAQGQG